MNAAAVSASSIIEATPDLTGATTPTVDASTAAVDGNLSQAVGRGNSADNEITVSTFGGTTNGTGSTAALSAFETDASAPALLVNGQSNYGAITARATSDVGIPLNATGSVSTSMLGVTGNSAVASAHGNAASNKLTDRRPRRDTVGDADQRLVQQRPDYRFGDRLDRLDSHRRARVEHDGDHRQPARRDRRREPRDQRDFDRPLIGDPRWPVRCPPGSGRPAGRAATTHL
jgi:hypothetical protein